MVQSHYQYEVLKRASLFLSDYERETQVAEMLLQHHLGMSRSAFFANMRDVVAEQVLEAFWRDIKAHAKTGVPVQQLMGYDWFYGRQFTVDQNVLIPRPETEELVAHTIDRVKNAFTAPPTIVDVGTGSGIIAITLALELPRTVVHATDISAEALAVARENAQTLGADVTFHQGHFLRPLAEKNIQPDIIASNPPYIAHADRASMTDTVKDYDPSVALFADNNGLAAYETIIRQAADGFAGANCFVCEIGFDQAEAVTSLIKTAWPAAQVQTIRDINGKDRIISASNLANRSNPAPERSNLPYER